MSNDNVLMEYLVQEASTCKRWITNCDRKEFEFFYTRVLTSLEEIGIIRTKEGGFFEVSLAERMEELERLENDHRIELEAAFLAVWLSKDMKTIREGYQRQSAIDILNQLSGR